MMLQQLLTLAADAEHAGPMDLNWVPAVTALVVFLVAFTVLRIKVWPMIVQGLDDRENKIRGEIASAEEAREQAKAALAEYESSLSTARQEATEMISKAKADAKAAADELRSRNDAELADLKNRARTEIESAKKAAISELHAEAAVLAAAIAGKILQREVSVDDQQQLVNEALSELGKLQEA